MVRPSEIVNDKTRGIKITEFGSKGTIDVNEMPAKTVKELLAQRNKELEEKEVQKSEPPSDDKLSIKDLESVKSEVEDSLEKSEDEEYKKKVKSTLHEVVTLLEQLIRD